jgi:hypothetical protein
MVWYVAVVAILNLALGYALAVYLRQAQPRRPVSDLDTESIHEESGDDGFDDSSEEGAYENELESSVSA